ncbi:opine oxidase subunit A [Leifsonia xyli subsp. xyli]|uniref:Opine oxidase subunit A n=2 Tax=Leifsonia xyli subsp. xyli TaxID=59736 RepID=Q6AFF6_LEIXX|nr:NAD(P)/FAD-dependent oxidoreductase [Leifsonia xyli]AAT88889.1 opine oxidase subunit A [Leifsonia xyli subsp. xyli str. CTCB07]ODA90375.1 opine oxidase subunit A [Leifsonia xyli subsp. xyli]
MPEDADRHEGTLDLALVGAGPAGMAAALAAADAGLSVVVLDEQPRAGGQIFRQAPREFPNAPLTPTAGYGCAPELIARFERHERLDRRFSSTVLGVLRDRDENGMRLTLAVDGPGASVVAARRILLATGTYDLPVAFPGWTLPGVMTAGAVQSLLKSQKIRAGDELVLAGAHPLLLIVADQLVAAGGRVAEVAFARGLPTPAEMAGALGAVPGHLGMLVETGAIVARLLARGVRISTRTIVTRACGSDALTSVELTRVDAHWRPAGSPRVCAADTLVLGYGFSPSTELARQAGCELDWDSPRGGWVVRHDERMATTAEGIFVAGEPTGVAGADQSRAEGTLAGLAVAQELRPASALGDALARATRQVEAASRFSTVVQRVFEPDRAGLARLAEPETTVCRCELVTRGRLTDALQANPFLSTANAAKLECRSGMGPCQGRYCEGTVAAIVAAERDQPIRESGRFAAQFPIKPVPLTVLETLDGDG